MKSTVFVCVFAQAASVLAAIYLGEADSFGVLSGQSITNTGNTAVTSNIGTAGVSITGFPPGIFLGAEHIGSLATPALNDAITAYDAVKGLTGSIPLIGDLGGMFLVPGTYSFTSTASLTGNLVLVGTGSSSDAWYFQIGSTLTTAASSSVILTRGAQPCMIFWQVGTSATFGAGSYFTGAVLAAASITMNTRAVSNGGLFALAGSVTMDTNVVNVETCPAPVAIVSTSVVVVISTVYVGATSTVIGLVSSMELLTSTTSDVLSSVTIPPNPDIDTSSYVLQNSATSTISNAMSSLSSSMPDISVTSVIDGRISSILTSAPGVVSSVVSVSTGWDSASTTTSSGPDMSVPGSSSETVPVLSTSLSTSAAITPPTLSTITSVASTTIIQPLVSSSTVQLANSTPTSSLLSISTSSISSRTSSKPSLSSLGSRSSTSPSSSTSTTSKPARSHVVATKAWTTLQTTSSSLRTLATSTRSTGSSSGWGMCDATCTPTRIVFITSRICKSTDTVVAIKTITQKVTVLVTTTKTKKMVVCTAPVVVPHARRAFEEVEELEQ